MTLQRALRPKEPLYLAVAAGVCVACLGAYAVAKAFGPWSPKRGFGLAFGILAAVLFVFEMLYPTRRPRARPFRTAKMWAQAHVYLGVVAFLGVLIHSDFGWPHGGMGWALLLLSAWTTLTGLVGVWLQKWVPAALSDGLRVEGLYERIPELVQKLTEEADRLVDETASDVVSRFYRGEVRPGLSTLAPNGSYLLDVRRGRERALEPFRRVAQFVAAPQREAVDDLQQIYVEKLELDAQYSLQGILRRWVVLHAPPAGLLMGLLAIHVMTWALY